MAITNLVASSVEGLEASSVTIIDNKGRLLSKKPEDSELAINSGKQYEVKSNIEKYLSKKDLVPLEFVQPFKTNMI